MGGAGGGIGVLMFTDSVWFIFGIDRVFLSLRVGGERVPS